MTLFTRIFIFMVFMSSFSVLAHAGHDHSHPMSNLIHLVWFLPVVVVAFFAVKFLLKELGFDHKE